MLIISNSPGYFVFQTKNYLLIMFLGFRMVLVSLLILIFFYVSKFENIRNSQSRSFECGFTSYFFSRFSFSIHYFLIALIFLFLDLELCFLMPLFMDEISGFKGSIILWVIVFILLLGLIEEWERGKLNWKN